MTTIVSVSFRSDQNRPKFPPKCVYCCGPADEYVDVKLDLRRRIGENHKALRNKFKLPVLGLTKRVRGFEIHMERPSTAMSTRWITTEAQLKAEVPFCREHKALGELGGLG